MIFLTLYVEFFKTGLFAVGGGLATLPFLYDLSDRYGWFTQQQLADMIAVSESTPGAIGVNMATYAGFATAGPVGAIVATLGLISPSIVIIVIIAHIFDRFKANPSVNAVFYGLRPASTALIAAAGFSVFIIDVFNFDMYTSLSSLGQVVNWPSILLAVIIFMMMRHRLLKQLHPVVFIAFAALVGMIFSF